MPYLKAPVTDLEGLIAEAKTMDTRQQELRGNLQETVRQRQGLEKRGTDLRLHLASILRGSLGFDDQTLLAFGVKPRRPRRKKKPGESSPQTPQTRSRKRPPSSRDGPLHRVL